MEDVNGADEDGCEEGLFPTDFEAVKNEFANEESCAVVLLRHVYELASSVPPGCQVTLILDCDHATSVLGPEATFSGWPIEGTVVKSNRDNLYV